MSELRSEWTPDQVRQNLGEVNESLPEARTTDRFPLAGTASGMDVRAGEEPYEEEASPAAGPGGALGLPPDPPRRPMEQGDR